MARTFTLALIRASARQRADHENSTFVSDAEVNTLLSASYAELYIMLVKAGLAFFESSATITASAGVATYAVPSDYLGTLGIDYVLTSSQNVELVRLAFQERNVFPNTGLRALAYRIVGSNVTLYPAPSAGQTYTHRYVPNPANLTTDSQTVDGVAGWEEFIIWDVAAKIKLKEESDASAYLRERDRLIERIQEEAELREAASPARITDVTHGGTDFPGDDPASWRFWYP